MGIIKRSLFFLMAVAYTVKKGYQFSRPQPGCHLRTSPWSEII
jgi:hypothetical protein